MMSPGVPKGESDIADAIEKWIKSGRLLEGIKQDDAFKVTALEQIMGVGPAKLHFDGLKARNLEYEDIQNQCRDYALRRRLEHQHKIGKYNMDLDAVEDGDQG